MNIPDCLLVLILNVETETKLIDRKMNIYISEYK